jgi:hypothetical protein
VEGEQPLAAAPRAAAQVKALRAKGEGAPIAGGGVNAPARQQLCRPFGVPRRRLVTMTVRDALRDAMAEEMRRDRTVFLMARSRAISGRLGSEPRLARRVRRAPCHRHTDHQQGFWSGRQRGLRRSRLSNS